MNKDNKSKPGASSKTEQHPVISAGRLWLFRSIAAVVIPVLTLVLLNIALYVIGYGYPASAVIKCRVDNQVAYCSNNKFGWQFFPPKVTREFEPFVVPAEKSDNTYRIFVLGESAAQGAGAGVLFWPSTASYASTAVSVGQLRSFYRCHAGNKFARCCPDCRRLCPAQTRLVCGLYGQQRGHRAIRCGDDFCPAFKEVTPDSDGFSSQEDQDWRVNDQHSRQHEKKP